MNFSKESIFRFFFVFIDQSIIEKKSIDDSILSKSFTSRIDDVFCAYNSYRLYKLTEISPRKFHLQDQTIEDESHQKIIETLLTKINNKNSDYQQEIDSKFCQQNCPYLDTKITLFIKILNFNIQRITYFKLELNMQFYFQQFNLNEIESAQIIFSHFFSYINDRDIFICKMIRSFAQEHFDFDRLEYELSKLEHKFEFSNSTFNINYENNKNTITDKTKTLHAINPFIDRQYGENNLSIHMRNFINFFYLFFEKFYIIVMDANSQKKIIEFFINKDAQIPFTLNYRNFLKIVNNFCLPSPIICIQKNNFTILNLILESIFSHSSSEIVLNISHFVHCESEDYLLNFQSDSEDVLCFFQKFRKFDKIIIQLGENQFKFDQSSNNFIEKNVTNRNLDDPYLNNFYFLSCVDLYTSKYFEKLPYEFKILLITFLKASIKKMNIFESLENICVVKKKESAIFKLNRKIQKIIQIETNSIVPQTFVLNHYFNGFTSKNNISKKKFFFCHHVENLQIQNFKKNTILTDNIFFAGKFDNMEVRTNKMIDICVNLSYTSFMIYKNNFAKNFPFAHTFKQTYSLNEYLTSNYKRISLSDRNFRMVFYNFMKIVSKNHLSSFFYNKRNNFDQILCIYDCHIELASQVPASFHDLSFTGSDIVFIDKKIDYSCSMFNYIKLHLTQSIIMQNPILNIKKCNFYAHRNIGNFELTFDNNSIVKIFEHKGKILLNNKFYLQFEAENSLFYYELNNMTNFNLYGYFNNRKKIIFRRITFINNVVFTLQNSVTQKMIQCKFLKGYRLYLLNTTNKNTLDIFESEGHENDYYDFYIDLTIDNRGHYIKMYT